MKKLRLGKKLVIISGSLVIIAIFIIIISIECFKSDYPIAWHWLLSIIVMAFWMYSISFATEEENMRIETAYSKADEYNEEVIKKCENHE